MGRVGLGGVCLGSWEGKDHRIVCGCGTAAWDILSRKCGGTDRLQMRHSSDTAGLK